MTPVQSNQFTPLQPIGENIQFFQPEPEPEPEPTPESNVTSSPSPALITLCTWLGGATTQRIQKYITGYRALYPNSAILLITTHILEISVLPFSTLRARLSPARDVIRQVVRVRSESDTGKGKGKGGILLHVFSHGGCNTAIQLALSLRMDPDPIHPVLDIGRYISGIIFDCCPGDTTFKRAYQAAALSLPRSMPAPGQIAGKVLLYPVVGIVNTLQQNGWMSSVRDLRAQLNNPGVFGTTAARLYLYSTADRMVGWENVEAHLEEARSALGCAVEGVAFEDSSHCALVRDYPGRYWGEIKRWMERRVVVVKPGLGLDSTSCDRPWSRL